MRSAYFDIGSCYAKLADISGNELPIWDLAIEAFENAASLYQDRPEALEAYFEMARAYLLTDRSKKAESTLRQALWVLQQLDEKDFEDPVIREMEWTKELWLNRLNILLNRIDGE